LFVFADEVVNVFVRIRKVTTGGWVKFFDIILTEGADAKVSQKGVKWAVFVLTLAH